ncbi:MAG: NAD(P)/FAD-dependent oxidoreductase [Myxococcota bacterium]
MRETRNYDDVVMGGGMGGLTVAALLARSGRKVAVLEAHDTTGGYAHTFSMGKYRFCAQVHYVFGCAPGESIHRALEALDLLDEVRFHRLDPEGYDHVVVAGQRVKIPSGLTKYRDQLCLRFPDAERPLRRYFATMVALREELSRLPEGRGVVELAAAAVRCPRLIRYRNWTLQRFYDHIKMPASLQAILAGQSGDYLLPPESVSLVLHASLVINYDRGAYYPVKHYSHLVDSITNSIRDRPGCDVLLEHEVASIETHGGSVREVVTKEGQSFRAQRFISNLDPSKTAELTGPRWSARGARPNYEYSSSTFTLYLGIAGLDLRDFGFGSHNVWHYPHADLNTIYRTQWANDLSDPWLFMSTPTLHSDAPGLAPPGHQILEVATSCNYDYFARLRAQSHRAYSKEKTRIRDRILAVIEERYVPGLRKHLAMRLAGTPLTNERFCWAPYGNAYGSALTASGTWPRVSGTTPFDNLHLVNATAGFPSVCGTVGSGLRLFERLRGN